MMQRRHEKLIYENDRGERVEIAYSFPYFLQQILGADGVSADISSTKNVGQDGVSINNVSLQPRPLQIVGYIKENSKDLLASRRDNLLRVFSPKTKGTLQYEYGNIKRQIRVQVDSAPTFANPFGTFEVLNFMIDLIAPSPYWTCESDIEEEIVTWIGGLSFPLRLPTTFSTAGAKIINILNQGHVETPVKIEITGTATNPKIMNKLTGEYIKVNRTLTIDDTLVITTDFGNKRVEQNGLNAFNDIDYQSTFFSLNVGDNVIELTTDDVNDNPVVKIIYRNRYLGV